MQVAIARAANLPWSVALLMATSSVALPLPEMTAKHGKQPEPEPATDTTAAGSSGNVTRRRRAQRNRSTAAHVAWLTSLLQQRRMHHTALPTVGGVSVVSAWETFSSQIQQLDGRLAALEARGREPLVVELAATKAQVEGPGEESETG